MTDGQTTEPAYTISSPGAFGSGELKIEKPLISISHSTNAITFMAYLSLPSSGEQSRAIMALVFFFFPEVKFA